MSLAYKYMNQGNQKQLFSHQEKLFQLWDEKQVQEPYRQWFLSVIDGLSQSEALKEVQLEQKRVFQNNSYFHQIKNATFQRTEILEKLGKYLATQETLTQACQAVKNLRDLNFRLCDLYLKTNEYSQSQGINAAYPGIQNAFKQIDQQNNLVRHSYLNEYVPFGNTFDPFFIVPYKISIQNKIGKNPSIPSPVKDMVNLNATSLYQFTRLRNKLIDYLCLQDSSQDIPYHSFSITPQRYNLSLSPNSDSLRSPQIKFKKRLGKIHRNKFQTCPDQQSKQDNSPQNFRQTNSLSICDQSSLRVTEKFSLPIIKNKRNSLEKPSFLSTKLDSEQQKKGSLSHKIPDRKTLHRKYEFSQSPTSPKLWQFQDDGNKDFQNRIKLRKKNKQFRPVKMEQNSANQVPIRQKMKKLQPLSNKSIEHSPPHFYKKKVDAADSNLASIDRIPEKKSKLKNSLKYASDLDSEMPSSLWQYQDPQNNEIRENKMQNYINGPDFDDSEELNNQEQSSQVMGEQSRLRILEESGEHCENSNQLSNRQIFNDSEIKNYPQNQLCNNTNSRNEENSDFFLQRDSRQKKSYPQNKEMSKMEKQPKDKSNGSSDNNQQTKLSRGENKGKNDSNFSRPQTSEYSQSVPKRQEVQTNERKMQKKKKYEELEPKQRHSTMHKIQKKQNLQDFSQNGESSSKGKKGEEAKDKRKGEKQNVMQANGRKEDQQKIRKVKKDEEREKLSEQKETYSMQKQQLRESEQSQIKQIVEEQNQKDEEAKITEEKQGKDANKLNQKRSESTDIRKQKEPEKDRSKGKHIRDRKYSNQDDNKKKQNKQQLQNQKNKNQAKEPQRQKQKDIPKQLDKKQYRGPQEKSSKIKDPHENQTEKKQNSQESPDKVNQNKNLQQKKTQKKGDQKQDTKENKSQKKEEQKGRDGKNENKQDGKQKSSESKDNKKDISKKQIQVKPGDLNLQNFFQFLQNATLKEFHQNNFEYEQWKQTIRQRNCFLTLFFETQNNISKLICFGLSSPNTQNYDYQILYWGVINETLNDRAESFVFKRYLSYLQKYTSLQKITLPSTLSNYSYFQQFGFELNPNTKKYERKTLNIEKGDFKEKRREVLSFQCSNLCVSSTEPSQVFYSEELQKFSKSNYCADKNIALCEELEEVKKISPDYLFKSGLPHVQYANNILEEAGLDTFQLDPKLTTPQCSLCYIKKIIKLTNYFSIAKGFFLYMGKEFIHDNKIIIKIEGEDQDYSIFLGKDFENILKFSEVCGDVDENKSKSRNFGVKMFSKQLYGATKFSKKRQVQGYGNWFCNLSWQNELKGVLMKDLPEEKYLFGPQKYFFCIFYKKTMLYALEICPSDFLF